MKSLGITWKPIRKRAGQPDDIWPHSYASHSSMNGGSVVITGMLFVRAVVEALARRSEILMLKSSIERIVRKLLGLASSFDERIGEKCINQVWECSII